MFYDTKLDNHNLPFNPFRACVVPRPIGWISSIDLNGVVNLAPYSYFNAVSDTPPIVMFSSEWKEANLDKDSLRNIEATGEFVVNIATYNLRDKVNLSSISLAYGKSETEEFGIETTPSVFIKSPRVKESPINFECSYIKTIMLDSENYEASHKIVIGHVIGIHIKDDLFTKGKIDIEKLLPISRLGYDEYAVINKIFRLKRP